MKRTKHLPSSEVKELSWLDFNERVLDEAADPTVPLLERLKFLGIYSNNLDEFFRVRIATLNRLARAPKRKAVALIGHEPQTTLREAHRMVLRQRTKFDRIYHSILRELAKERIFILSERKLTAAQGKFVEEYFHQTVRPRLFPIMIDGAEHFPELKDKSIYLAVVLGAPNSKSRKYALIEVPTDDFPRFVQLLQHGQKRFIILLDDIIRFNLRSIFAAFGYRQHAAYTIKLTRDAELDIDNDIFESYVRKISKSLRQRKEGQPVRLLYDAQIPKDLLRLIAKRLHIGKNDPIIAGSRYHNFKDFMKFPDVGRKHLRYSPTSGIPHRAITAQCSLLEAIDRRDIMLHFPYQPFDHMIDLLREASIDPRVHSIKITLYRTARNSSIVNALLNAVKNGKNVTAVVELQARFDEEANIYWANELQEAGAKVVFGVPGLKVHAKLCLITLKNGGGKHRYASIATGNFNEDTARVYTDHFLLTKNEILTEQVAEVFDFLEKNYRIGTFRDLLVAPFNMRRRLSRFIDKEIDNAVHGKEAWIFLKLNHLTDAAMIRQLYKASQAGVEIRLIVRGMFTLQPGIPGLSDKIQAVRLVDKYLEHSRVLIFANAGDPLYYISSADWMPRNLDRRVEVGCPIWDKALQAEIKQMLELQWRDTAKSREYSALSGRRMAKGSTVRGHRAQVDICQFLKDIHKRP